MRPTLRRNYLRLIPIAIVAACALLPASSATGITLYEGSYATDMSSSTPGGLAPANGTSLPYPDSNISLSWQPVPGASRYEVQLARQAATNADCSSSSAFQLDNIVVTAETSQTDWVPSLTSAEEGEEIWVGAYCWRVRTTGKGSGEWSTSNRFVRTWNATIGGLRFFNDHDGPVPRTSSSPDWATGSTVTRNAGYLTWTDLPGAATYEVQVSSSRAFSSSSTMVRRDGIRGNRVALLHLPDDTYYWRVRGIAPNGTEGGWTNSPGAFTVRWLDASWSASSKLYPADSTVQSDLRIGWTPMPGATHYEYQVGTGAGCFWNPDVPALAPTAYGAWVGYEVRLDDSDPPNVIDTGDPQQSHCRISDVRATTINNWVTVNDMFGSEATANMATDCWPITSTYPVCEPATWPMNYSVNFGAGYHGIGEAVNSVGDRIRSGDGQYSEPYQIYWRVRPVYHVEQDNETGWEISGDDGLSAYGSWSMYTDGGANRHHRFELDPGTAATTSTDTRCVGFTNPAGGCLEHIGSSMQADEVPGETHDPSMQFPVMTWRPFSGADGYVIEIARDPLFNNIAVSEQTFFGTQQSHALTRSLPDNAEGTGYWWRVVPCRLETPLPGASRRCMPQYSSASAGLPVSYGLGGYSDDGVAQTFTKESALQVEVVDSFEGASPLIRWARADVASTDYSGWSRGLEGAEHYQLQVARDPFFTRELEDIYTTIPRAVPFTSGEELGSVEVLPDGLWYYRVRAIDRNDIEGAWSATGSFNKRVTAPTPTGANGESGPGVVVSWTEVTGATGYEVQWATSTGFSGKVSSGTTLQNAFRIPDASLGRMYWRVRALVGPVEGQWSGQVRYVDIVPPTTIRYGLNRSKTLARDRVQITGELKVDGAARNNERLRLQRKTGGCDNTRGRYVDSSVAITGQEADDGMVNIPARLVQNTCFRFSWTNGSTVRYSAPIETKVVPYAKVFKNRKVVRRSKPMCVSIRSNVLINGRARVQYRVGKGWRTARSMMLRNKRAARTCVRFTKAGRYSTRVYFDKMTKRGQGWVQYENVMRGMGMVRVNDVWRIVRSR